MAESNFIVQHRYGLSTRLLCLYAGGDARGNGKLYTGENEGEEEKINPHVLVSTRKRKVLSARVGRAEAGTIKCTESATKGGVPSSDKCNSEKPREMFVIGIVGPSCSLGA